jgi:peptidoglycan/xylan/chitin deacetylase (PgdA/CDA1 family)
LPQTSHRRAKRSAGRRRLHVVLLVVFVAVGVAVLLSVRSGADTSVTDAGSPTSVEATTASSRSEDASLPSTLPPDAIAVQVPILMYHYVDDEPPPAGPYADNLTVRTKDFIAEMDYLVKGGYSTVSLADVYKAMAGEKELPAKPVVLTFDDGGVDNYQVAFPILEQRGLSGTFFVITGSVGKEGQRDWDQLTEMAAKGMSIQSHTVSHPDLRGVSASRLRSELVDSREAIAEAIGEPSYVLCYPSGAYDATVIEAARASGYLMAVTTDQGREGDPTAVFEMKRRRVPAFLPLDTFAKLVR